MMSVETLAPPAAAPSVAGLPGLRLARSAAEMQPAVLLGLLARASHPEVISFALGMPDLELFPRQAFGEALAGVLRDDPLSLQYLTPLTALKAHVSTLMEQRTGRPVPESRIVLTAGAQQGMLLLVQMLLDPGGRVLLEEIVYEGIQMAVRGLSPEIVTVPTSSESGVDVEAVERAFKGPRRPAFVYLIPDGHNPLGASLSLEKRKRLAELARRYQVPIIEDDAYGHLYYDEEPLPPLVSLDDRWVFHLGSFSKILAPGLRLGWVVVPEELVPVVSGLKHAADLNTANFVQHATVRYLDGGTFEEHLRMLRRQYRRRRNAMCSALAAHLPPSVQWTVPKAGMFVWARLPDPLDAFEVVAEAIDRERVAFSPGRAFAAGGSSADPFLRISFANYSEDIIEEGVRRLGEVFRRVCSD
ncbi:MAG: PLP-dependent aminotransferase family protein [Acidobacteria bacterium]|nr:PLP-dependent aminotransferase family protein [Acidobacteriota bacterium]